MESNKVYDYRWREPFNNVWHTTRCKVVQVFPKSLKIELLGFGKNGTRPSTQMVVRKNSVMGWADPQPQTEVNDSWKKWSYFD